MTDSDCPLCAGTDMDEALMRTEVWSNDLWRLTTSNVTEVAGFSYLEPKRHIVDIAELDGEEAATFGVVIGRVAAAIKAATGVDRVFVYIFGESLDHLHVHLAPHRNEASPLIADMIKGAQHRVILPNGQEVWVSDRYPLQDSNITEAAIADIRELLTEQSTQ